MSTQPSPYQSPSSSSAKQCGPIPTIFNRGFVEHQSPEPRSRVVMARLPVDEVFDEEHKNIAVQIIASLVDPGHIRRALKRKSFRLRAVNIFFMHPEHHSLHYREYAGWYAVFSTMNDALTSNNWAMFFKGSVVQDICFKLDNTRELSKFSYYATRLLHPGCRAEDVNFLINYMENWLPIKKDLLDSLQEQDPSSFVPVLKEKAYDIFSTNHMYMSCFKTASAALGATIHRLQSPPHTQSKPSSAVAIPANVAPPPPPPPDSDCAHQGGRGLKRRASKPPLVTDQSQLPPLKVRSQTETTENNIVLPQMTLPQSDDNGQHQPVPPQPPFTPFTPLFVPGTPGLHFYPPLGGGREAEEASELFPEDPSDLATPPSRDNMNIEVCEQYLRSPNTDHSALSAISAAVMSELQNPDRTPFGTTLAHMPHVQCIQGAVFLFNAFLATLSFKAGFPLMQHTTMMPPPSSILLSTDLSKLELLGYDGSFCRELKVLAESIETKPFPEWPLLFPEHLHFIVSLHVVSSQTSPHTRGTAFQDIGHLVAKEVVFWATWIDRMITLAENIVNVFDTDPDSTMLKQAIEIVEPLRQTQDITMTLATGTPYTPEDVARRIMVQATTLSRDLNAPHIVTTASACIEEIRRLGSVMAGPVFRNPELLRFMPHTPFSQLRPEQHVRTSLAAFISMIP